MSTCFHVIMKSLHPPNDIQVIPIEVNLKERKVVSIYRSSDRKLEYFLLSITDLLNHHYRTYEALIVRDDFNESETIRAMDSFLDNQKCKIIMKNNIYFKSVKGSCSDLILTSRPNLHQFTNVFKTEVSGHHLLIYTTLSSAYTKMKPKVLTKRCFSNFSEKSFLQDLKRELSLHW